MVKILIERTGETKEIVLDKPKKIKEILKDLNISVSSVLILKNKQISLEEQEINNEDSLELLAVVSGG